ncbi:MAG: 50S ribosomal protein L29 [Wolbachia endosymbiont of Ctenocephalides orientis wCori]|nr:MAG: 50S ribosomal protein L29 [Wolbachia endosymbiont of Ctenocephalides orientis wCori]
MNIAEIRSKSSQELYEILVALRKEFVNLSFQKEMGQYNTFSRFGLIKRSIARILTALNERKREGKDA